MKREIILFYMINDKIFIYLTKAKREIIKEFDTSSFFKCGEISNVKHLALTVNKIIDENKVLTRILKPNLIVLYNDITSCDLNYLYEKSLLPFNYEKIDFVPLSKIIKMINEDERIVFFDKNYYTVFKDNYKTLDKYKIDFKPIYIGKNNTRETHYSNNLIVWNTFISCFTKN